MSKREIQSTLSDADKALGPVVIKNHQAPAPKPHGGRPGKWNAIYKAIESLRAGETRVLEERHAHSP